MSKLHMPKIKNTLILSGALLCGVSMIATEAYARSGYEPAPSLIITSDDLPEHLREKIYSKPVQVRTIKSSEITGRAYKTEMETLVTRKVNELNNDLYGLQRKVENIASKLQLVEKESEKWAADYYADVATINTQLQSGTTRGNPRLVNHLTDAERTLESLADSLVKFNAISSDAAEAASQATFLLEETRAAYGISGAVEEDHVRLAEVEDLINNTLVVIERVLNTANDDITRTSTYLSSERNNLRTLSLAVTNGDLYGKSLANRPFSSAANAYNPVAYTPTQAPSPSEAAGYPAPTPAYNAPGALPSPRPLAKIRFDQANVEYQQPIYAAVNEALERYPNARFDLVAVQPTQGNAAQIAIESTKARRNAEKVLRTLTQMGLPLEKIDLSYSKSAEAATNEVHLFVK